MQLDRPLAVITPTLDGDVLAYLAWRQVGSTPGQIHYELGRYSSAGIRRALTRLREQGVVLGRPTGNTTEYRLNRDHLAASAIVDLGSARTRLVERIAAQLSSWTVPPVYAALFGAAARGRMAVRDEIDLFVAYSDASRQPALDQEFDDLAAAVREWTGNDANIVDMAEGEVVRRLEDDVIVAVRHGGLRVLGAPSWLEHQVLLARELPKTAQI